MNNIFGRLKFVHHEEVFNTREDAYAYVLGLDKLSRPSVVGEPMVLLYKSDDDEKGPNVVLAIGSVGDGTASMNNRTFFIDTKKTEDEVTEMSEVLDNAIESLTVLPLETDTIKMSAEKTDEGTTIKGDVKTPEYKIHDMVIHNNIIETYEDGLYAFVDMSYDQETSVITFNVNGVAKEINLPADQHVVSGRYDTETESIILTLADRSEVSILVTKLIEEWTVLPDGQSIVGHVVSGETVYYSPIVMYKTHVRSSGTEHEGIFDWQDILEADVRVADHIPNNILHKDATGRYLYVKGTADNIRYKNGKTVEDALDDLDVNVSTSYGNLIYKREDGIFATAMLSYNAAENKLVYKYSDGTTGDVNEVEIQLNSVQLLDDISYDSTTESIIIRYTDATGTLKRLVIPVKDIIEEWVVNNEGHNIQLDRFRSSGSGADILSADAKIFDDEFNILEDKNHSLFVNGVAANIIYDVDNKTTVKEKLAEALENEVILNERMDTLRNTIGSGFTSDPHENVTYQFNALSDRVAAIESGGTGSTAVDELSAKTITDVSSSNGSLASSEGTAADGTKTLDLTTDASMIKMEGFTPGESGFTGITEDSSISDAFKTVEDDFVELAERVAAIEEGSTEAVNELSAKTISEIASDNGSVDATTSTADDGTVAVNLATDSSKIKMSGFTADASGFTGITEDSTISEAFKSVEGDFESLADKVAELEASEGETEAFINELSAKTITDITSANDSIDATTSTSDDGTVAVDLVTDASKIKMSGFTADESGFTGITEDTTISDGIKEIENQFLINEYVISSALNDLNTRILDLVYDTELIDTNLDNAIERIGELETAEGETSTVLSELSAKTITELESSDNSISIVDGNADDGTVSLDLTTDASIIKMKGYESEDGGFTGITSSSTVTEAFKEVEVQFLMNEYVVSDALNDLNTRLIDFIDDMQVIDCGTYEGNEVIVDYSN